MSDLLEKGEVYNPLRQEVPLNKHNDGDDQEIEETFLKSGVYGPEKVVSQRKRRKFLLYFLGIVFLSSVVDILVYSYSSKQFAVEESRLLLESDTADAELVMTAHVKLNSLLHSFNVNDGHCKYFYTPEGESEKKQVSNIYGYFDHDSEASKAHDKVKINFELHDTDYAQLRHLLWAYHTGSEATTSVECSAQVTVNAFKLFPLTMDIKTENVLDGQVTFKDDFSLEKEGKEPSVLQMLQNIQRFLTSTFTVKDISSSSVDIHATNTISTINSVESPFPVKSFVVEMPQISFAIDSVARVTAGKVAAGDATSPPYSRIVISSTPVSVELGEAAGGAEAPFSATLSATCSQFNSVEELLVERGTGGGDGGTCGLFSALHMASFIDELAKGHMHIHADSTRANFVSSLLGENHFLSGQKYIPPAADGRALTDMLSPRDPDVSTGASCLVLDGDSMLESVACFQVDKGFMTTYLDLYDNDGSMAVIKGTTAWAVDGGFAFDGQYVVVVRGGYAVVANVTGSEDFQNASALMSYSQDQEELVRTNLFTSWNTWRAEDGLPAADVQYWLQYDEHYNTPGRFNSTGGLSFGDSMYELNVQQDSTLNSGSHWVGSGHAQGQYEGGLLDWRLTVDASQYAVDSVVKGSMTALLSSDIASDGTLGDAVIQGDVLDGSGEDYVSTATTMQWSSDSSWSVEGDMNVNSRFISDFVNWDNYNTLSYKDKAYALKLEHYDQNRFERMMAIADGTCGGVVTQWHFTVDNSALWLDEVKKGTMTLLLSSEVNMPGTVGDLRLDTEVLEAGTGGGVVMSTENRAQWSSPLDDAWTTAGHVEYNTVMDMPGVVNWNSDGHLTFASNEYDTEVTIYEYSGATMYNVIAEGKYSGYLYDGQISVEHSELYTHQQLKGTMTGEVASRVYSAGKGANMTAVVLVKDPSGVDWLVTNNVLAWEGYGTDFSWGAGGSAALETDFYYDEEESDTLNWDVSLGGQFADQAYDFKGISLDRGADMRWAVSGEGVYHGDIQDFSVTLDYSELKLSAELFGTAVGEVRASVPGVGTSGEVYFSSEASDADGAKVMATSNSVLWLTEHTWGRQGLVDLNSTFYVKTCAGCSAVVTWNAKEHFVHDDGTYGISLVNEKTSGQDLFLATAAGGYGGVWTNWWVSLEESDLVIDQTDYGSATGLLTAEVRDYGSFADISLVAQALNDQDVEVMSANLTADWSTDSVWSSSGRVDYSVALQVMDMSGSTYLSPPFVVYGSDSNQANYQTSFIYVCPYDNVQVSLCNSRATCYEDTYLSLFKDGAQLMYNDDFCNLCSSVQYYAYDLTECAEVEVRYGCYGDTVCSGSAAITQESFKPGEEKPTSYFLDFNRFRKLSYGQNKYWHETKLFESNGQEHLYNIAHGTYGGEPLDWFFSIDYAELRYQGVKQADISLSVTSEIPYPDGAKGDLTAAIRTHVPDSKTGQDEDQLDSTNMVSWDGHDASRYISAHVYTDTSWSTEPQFFLETMLDIDNEAKRADFSLLDKVLGEEQARINATAWYSTRSGMMTGIDMTVRFQEEPVASAHMFLNAQTSTLSLPEPSSVPTAEPSGMPTAEPTNLPTVPTGVPSGVPSAMPSNAPSRKPVVTSYPSHSPTIYIPVVTVVSFSTLAQLGGITAADMDLPAQEAFLDVTAGSMTGVDASDLVITSMDTVTVARRQLRSGSVEETKRRLESAVDITFTTTTILENTAYSSAISLAEGLDAEVTAAYADPATATAFTAEAEALGSANVDSTTTVVFEEPVLDTSSITEEVVRTSAPTVTVAVNSSGDDDNEDTLIVALLAVLIALVALGLLSAAGYFFYRNKQIKSDKSSGNVSSSVDKTENPLQDQDNVKRVSEKGADEIVDEL